MRLSPFEKQCIVDAISKSDSLAKIYLYGSRTIDSAKGGDIDILVISDVISFGDKISILATIKQIIGDQKIDLKLLKSSQIDTDAFYNFIKNQLISLI